VRHRDQRRPVVTERSNDRILEERRRG
jgi:hypothetical protein